AAIRARPLIDDVLLRPGEIRDGRCQQTSKGRRGQTVDAARHPEVFVANEVGRIEGKATVIEVWRVECEGTRCGENMIAYQKAVSSYGNRSAIRPKHSVAHCGDL